MVMEPNDSCELPKDMLELSQVIAGLLAKNRILTEEKEALREEKESLLTRQTALIEEKESWLAGRMALLEEKAVLIQQAILLENKVSSLADEIERLKEQLALLKAKRFGKSSEKLDKQIDELELRIEDKEVEQAKRGEAKTSDVTVKGKKRTGRVKLPEHLERIDNIIPAPIVCDKCGGKEFRKISDDISEVLEYIPSSFKVIRNIRPRCACKNCSNIVQAYAPSNAIDKGKAGAGMLAHILVQKYCNHLPFYRQSQMYMREGVEIARSTLTSWAGQCARLLELLVQELRKEVFSSTHIHGDDTPVKVLAPNTGKTKIGRMWVYLRDGRAYRDKAPPAIIYFYSPDRKGERPREHLLYFKGVLHADAYAGYDIIYEEQEIDEAGCWSHTRRKFYEVALISDNAAIANLSLEEIGKLYEIEEKIKGMESEERARYRQDESKEIVEGLFSMWKESYSKLPPKGRTAKAIAYALNNEEALKRFLGDGKIAIDNNPSERALRPIALGRKNWLFAGSDGGGETAANIYTLIETAKANELNPEKYLHYVLANIQDYNSQKLADLLPWNVNINST
jgi:transposase